jgi:hypothetical protein
MATLFKKPGLQEKITDKLVNVNTGFLGQIVLYILVAIILVAIVLMLLGVKIDYNWFDFRSPYTRVMSRSSVLWKPTFKYTNLTSVPNFIPGFQDNSYTTIIDCVIFNTRAYKSLWTDGDGPYRHIYHRGSNELQTSTLGNVLLSGCGPTGNMSELPPYGLPSRMNPGVFLDPNLNDIIVFVDTDKASRESVRIVDIPLDIPFRIAIVVNKLVLEVYLNCRLEVTKILAQLPKAVENQWYGLAGPAGAQAQIQNLHIWNDPLSSVDIRPLCPGLPLFSAKRPMCEGADTVVPVETAKEPSINLGFDKAISKCPN